MSDPFIAQISTFAFNFAPRGWAFCNGSLLAISSNTSLYALLGTIYGGDGRTTLGLPNLTSRSTVAYGSNAGALQPFIIGQWGGAQECILNHQQLPTHHHVAGFEPTGGGSNNQVEVKATTEDGNASAASAGAYLAQPSELPGPDTRELIYKSNPTPASLVPLGGVSGGGNDSGTVTLDNSGGNQGFSIKNPYVAMNFSIALLGIFPSRN